MKKDLSSGDLVSNDNTAALLSAYIIQAECGDFNTIDYPDYHYISQFKLIPNQDDDFQLKVMENHKQLMYVLFCLSKKFF